ncbi:MAG: cytochrome c [Candidatus Acidiferrales bacterium]|jgi:mono/diheme cytochrome c family protein|nr:cytochrome c [Candidatus Acidoferrales bacterium]
MRKRTTVCLAVLIFILVIVVSMARVAAQTMKESDAEDVAKGKQVYAQKCEICHYSASAEKKIGPGLAGLMKRERFRNGMKADDENLRRVIERGGKDMPGYRNSLKPAQIRDLIAYVKTL